MALNVKERLIEYLLSRQEEEGFTLVELIVVVMIIGILSSIAIPSFMNAGDKAKQVEAATLVSSYLKAAQAYYLTHSEPPTTDNHLSEFVSVLGCDKFVARGLANPVECKTKTGAQVGPLNSKYWNSPSGIYNIVLQSQPGITGVIGLPAGAWQETGYGVTGCFIHQTGSTNVVLHDERGWASGGSHDQEANLSIEKYCRE